ncbi:MAG: hypothetical protein HY680_06985 [Chloroflexi bacterium]|nr:hypothetical protein [Chloroflexota bacterium]
MSERYRREIEDILDKIEGVPSGEPAPNRRPSPWKAILSGVGKSLARRGSLFSPGRVMLTALVLLIVAAVLNASIPGAPFPLLAAAAGVLFLLGYALFWVNATGAHEKRWRGHPIESPPTILDRLRRLMRR